MTALFDGDTVARLSERTREPDWLAERRRAAFERFNALPWPDQTAEEWKHTDIRKLDLGRFDAIPPENQPVAELEDLPTEVRALAIGQKGDRLGLGVRMDADLVHVRLAPKLA
ncbi:MAG: Fe-S cluster assembly protein SufD, partial [Acidimicrobiaceae bacterium]|nr:Fe-S cluster assembly protein SufD [Acidimicrobiaceae bacterium]